MKHEVVHRLDLDALFTGGRSDLMRLEVYPTAVPAWTKLIEDLHLQSTSGRTSAGAVRWEHRQAPIVWGSDAFEIVSYRRWDRAPVHRQGTLDWLRVEDGTATIVVASIHRVARPGDVEITLYGSTIDAPLRLFDQIRPRLVPRHSEGT